jgi:hypothetical protein
MTGIFWRRGKHEYSLGLAVDGISGFFCGSL